MTHDPAVTVALDGSPGDLPALAWAVEQAGPAGEPLVLAHAAGALPTQLSYADRHVARRERRAGVQWVVERGAAEVSRRAPGLPVRTVVRLISGDALLQALADGSRLLVPSSATWVPAAAQRPGAPVLAAAAGPVADSPLLQLAGAYAAHRGLGVRTPGPGEESLVPRLLELAEEASLVLLPLPRDGQRGLSWPMALALLAESPRPVVLVRDATRR